MSESVFDMSDILESINGGADRYDMQQIYPISGNVTNNTVGSGNASGLSTFQWQDSANWWSPSQSYFSLIVQFSKAGTAGALPEADLVTYCDNFAMTLFTQIQTYINSRPLDTVNTPWLIDTALSYSNARSNFLKTWGSLSRLGEGLKTRLRNATKNGGNVEVVFRPPVSLFDVKLLPPGAQFRIDLNWASSAQNAFQGVGGSVAIGSGAGQYNMVVQSLSFYKAAIHPSPSVVFPERGVIDLMPCVAQQYIATSSTTLKQNITIPSTTNRILIVFQDTSAPQAITGASNAVATRNPNNNWTGVGNGYNPVTSFSNIFSTVLATPTFPNAGSLQSLWLSLPELGIQAPNPIYNFDTGKDYLRAYSDWCSITQGTKDQVEGSVPFGNGLYNGAESSPGSITIVAPNITVNAGASATYQSGDKTNPNEYEYITSVATAYAAGVVPANLFNQTALWGWFGANPGPIFAFPVVRPEGKTVSTGTLNVTFNSIASTPPLNVTATIIASYSMAIAVELQQNGYYHYSLVEGV